MQAAATCLEARGTPAMPQPESSVDWIFVFSCAAHNLMRLPRLIAHQALEGFQQQCA